MGLGDFGGSQGGCFYAAHSAKVRGFMPPTNARLNSHKSNPYRARFTSVWIRSFFHACSIFLLFGSGCTVDNGSPRADASRTLTDVEAEGEGTIVLLDGSASQGGAAPITEYEWILGDQVLATGAVAEVELPVGEYEIKLRIANAIGQASLDSIVVKVVVRESESHTLTIAVVGEGSTSPPPGELVVESDASVSLLALPAQGWQFAGWSGDVEGDLVEIAVEVDDDLSVSANFEPIPVSSYPGFHLPFPAGRTLKVSQGNDELPTHLGRFAWDFPMAIGEPVLAAAAGRVVDTRDSTPRNQTGATEFTEPANFVLIDHGDGLQSLYAHLDYLGVVVVPGQFVVAGQTIGYACDTGQSTGPHLHFEVLDASGQSTHSSFFEVPFIGGIPEAGDYVTSENEFDTSSLDDYEPSHLPIDAFEANFIELAEPTPPANFYTAETDYSMRGRVHDGHTKVCVALVNRETNETEYCELQNIEADGSFAIPVRFPTNLVGRHFLAVISGDAGAEGTTDWAVQIDLPDDGVPAPIARIAPAEVDFVDFLQPFDLDGTTSQSFRGESLTYHWTQASGPPVVFSNIASPTTRFHVDFGPGHERVSLQLVVFDGVRYSKPAQIDFTMPDVFFVKRIGIADTLCDDPDRCPVYDPPPALISFSTQVIMGWVELVNAQIGDELVFTLTDPDGHRVLSNAVEVLSDPSDISFWQFAMPSNELELLPGVWRGTFLRNFEEESSVEFRVMP